MPRKPIRAPAGFLTPADVVQRARVFGINLKAKTISRIAHKGKIPFARKIPAKEKTAFLEKGIMFPESKLIQVIAACPGQAIAPKGMYTARDIYKLAKQKGLKVSQWNIVGKLERIFAGREPLPGTIAQDALHRKHRYFFSKEFVDAFLRDARHRKNLPRHLEAGRLIPLQKLAAELGLQPAALYRYKSLKKLEVNKKFFVSRKDAEGFKEEYLQKRSGAIPHPGIILKKAAKPKKPAIDHKTKQEAEWWLRNIVPTIRVQTKKEEIRSLLLNNMHLSHGKFRKEILSKINKMLE